MKLVHSTFLSILFVLIALSAQADFSNMATLSINGSLIRRVVLNTNTPHLVNLSKFKVGDTLHVDLWTDHGAEDNAFIRIIDMENDLVTILKRNNSFIITPDFLNHDHLISATFIYQHREEFQINSDLFQTTQSNQIELIHRSLDDFSELLIDVQSENEGLILEIFNDSVAVNFALDGKSKSRNLTDTTYHSDEELRKFLKLNQEEIDYFDGFSGIDYFTIYNLGSKLYGSLKIDSKNLNQYQFSLGNWDYRIQFHFIHTENHYKLTKILLQ